MQKPYERLNAHMNSRRLDLDLSWEEVADRARMTSTNLRAIRRGTTRPSELGARRLEDALDWKSGSIARILEGGEPELTAVADYMAFIEQYADARGMEIDEAWAEIKARAEADERAVERETRSRSRKR